MSKLNYSKWDNLELSDDSDVEVHPNVDKKSFIRWKQRDIHEKRDQRKQQLVALKAERDTNAVLQPKLDEIYSSTKSEGHAFYSREVSRLSAERASRGNKDSPNGPTPNDMILSLLLQINEESSVKGKSGSDLDEALVSKLDEHRGKLKERITEVVKQIETMEADDKRKITSDGLRDGFNTGHVAKREEEEEDEEAKKPSSSKAKAKSSTTTYETINAPKASGSSTAAAAASSSAAPDSDADDDDEETPDLTPAMKAFALLPACIPSSIPLTSDALPPTFKSSSLSGSPFSAALDFLSSHKALLRSKDGAATDAMLVEAFQSELRGEKKRARQFVEKGLMLQYLTKLGPDGVNLFFRRMAGQDGKAVTVFFNDVLSTYVRIAKRCEAIRAEDAKKGQGAGEADTAGQEQIQLVAEDPSTVIGFDVPEGPAPDHIELEGEEAKAVGEETVRAYLDRRWEIFQAFSDEMKEALKTKELDKVNKVLGEMQVDEAEAVVAKLDEANILSFSSHEVRDETGK